MKNGRMFNNAGKDITKTEQVINKKEKSDKIFTEILTQIQKEKYFSVDPTYACHSPGWSIEGIYYRETTYRFLPALAYSFAYAKLQKVNSVKCFWVFSVFLCITKN